MVRVMTQRSDDSDTATRHSAIATRLLGGRTWVSAPVVAPDGSQTAFVVSTIDLEGNTTVKRIWLERSDGTVAPLTAGPDDGSPRFSLDGRALAFTSKRSEKKGETTLHVLPVDGPGEVRTVCAMPDGVSEVRWSPDGSWLAFTSRTQDERYEEDDDSSRSPRKVERFFSRLNGENWVFDRPQHVYVVSSSGSGTPRNLTPGEFQHSGISWLPDSSAVITSGARHDTWDLDLATDLFLVTLDGEITEITHQTGRYESPVVSPDGTKVAFVGERHLDLDPQNAHVGVVDLPAGGGPRWISDALDRTFWTMSCTQAPVWQDDDTVLAVAEDRGETHLYRVRADGGATPEALTKGPMTVQGYDTAGGTTRVATAAVDHPGELAALEGDITSLTTRASGWERFAVPTTDGTNEIDAWIMRPVDFDENETYPVLLNVHGGPHTQYGETFFDEAQMQAAAGFVVLMSNPRGGSGREEAWGQAIMGERHPVRPGTGWGSVDVDDVLAVLDHALATYSFCDGDRVGMLGGSYGGYMATWLASHHGDRFKGICSERAASNLVSMEWCSDIATAFKGVHGMTFVEDDDAYRSISPSSYAKDIHVPMLILHSEEDWRCPIGQAEELWVTLRLLQRDVTFYRFPGENHELSRSGSPVHRRQRAEIILDWFSDKLAPSASTGNG